ncbi:MAG: DPP IV N-terminal domain-containing protein [Acidobacteriota bacterium]|nr:DPP IV N-terminal domain-containing protein [Acidobacteriota bacterium]
MARHTLAVLLAAIASVAAVADDRELLTVAEQTEYRAAGRYEQVIDYARDLDARSDVVRLDELGETVEGRSIPLLFIADPMVTTPDDLRGSDRLLVLLFGGIHGGEICGQEAFLMLARELGTTPDHPLLRDLVVAVVPIYNPDGADRVAVGNRKNQIGPVDGQGERHNAQDLDLNRDWVKAEAPETRAMLRFLRRWDPALIIDSHTTNGSFHEFALTYDGPKNPAGNPEVIEFVREVLLPEASGLMEEETGYRSFFYGNFNEAHTEWRTYPDLPRFGTPYRGLRNRLAVLSEAHAYIPFEDRVLVTKAFALACLEVVAEHGKEVRDLLDRVDDETVRAGRTPGPDDRVAVRSRLAAFDGPVEIPGFVERELDGKMRPTEQKKTYEVEHFGRFEAVQTVARPSAYLYPATFTAATEALLRHGIEVQELREEIEIDVEVHHIDRIGTPENRFWGTEVVALETTASRESRGFSPGHRVVRTAQPLGDLAVYLLEPGTDDGLRATGVLDDAIDVGREFPIVRVPAATPLTTRALLPPAEDRPRAQTVTYDAVYGDDPVSFSGPPISMPRWMEDGEHFVQKKEGRFYRVEAVTGRPVPLADEDAMTTAIAALDAFDESEARRIAERLDGTFDPAFAALLFEHDGDLYYAALDGSEAVRLTDTEGEEELATFSPDGRYVAYVRGFDLWVADLDNGTERQLTKGGTETVRHARATFVYYEELLGRRWKAFWWSPDSRSLAFMRFDDTDVPRFTLVDDIPIDQETEITAYPKPGQPNPVVGLGVVSVDGGKTRWADLSAYDPADLLIGRVEWWPDGKRVMFLAMNRVQTWLDVNAWTFRRGSPVRLLRETTDAWTSARKSKTTLLEDGGFVMLSERTGWSHAYHYDPDGTLAGQITSGEWEVRDVVHVDESEGAVYFTGTRHSHVAENLYRVGLDGTGLTRLTTPDGSHRISMAPTGDRFVDRFSSRSRPSRIELRALDGSHLRTLDTNPVRALEEFRVAAYERVRITTGDGFVLEGTLLRPPDFDPGKRYPVWFTTYGGPQSPRATDHWPLSYGWEQVLAANGLVVFSVDPRSASGKGAGSAWTAYRQLGVQELEDIVEAIEWISAKPWVDPSRIGMSGGSYGGFMTVYAMTHTELFAAGIARAPVTDWRDYDSIYTERSMGTPEDNPEGYETTSAVDAAADLHGRLLLLHGSMDDNVHFQNSLRLVRALQRANKTFEMMIYPQARHALHGAHRRKFELDFILRTLGGGPAVEPAVESPPSGD